MPSRWYGEEEADETLSAAYRRVLQSAQESNPLVVQILERVTFVGHERIPVWLLRGSLPRAVDTVDFGPALEYLRNISVISLADKQVSMHPLTQKLFRSLLADRQGITCLALHRPIAQRLDKIRCDRTLPPDAASLIPHAFAIVRGLASVDQRYRRTEQVGHTLAVVIAGMRQLGDWELSQLGVEWDELAYAGGVFIYPQLTEAVIEWLTHEFDVNARTPAEYCDALCRVLQARYQSEDYLSRLDMRELLYVANAARIAGRQDILAALFSEQQIERIETCMTDSLDMGDLFLIRGDFEAENKGQRDEADLYYKTAELHYYPTDTDQDRATRISRTFLVAKRRIQNQLKLGNGGSANGLLEDLNDLIETMPGPLPDAITQARYAHMTAMMSTRRLLEHVFVSGWTDAAENVASSIDDLLDAAMKQYVNAGAVNEREEAELDTLLLIGARYPSANYHWLVDSLLIPGAEGQGFHGDCLVLTMFKLLLSWRAVRIDSHAVARCKELAYQFAAAHQSSYWYTEALLASWLMAVRAKCSPREIESLSNAAEQAAKGVHRSNRLKSIRQMLNDPRLRYLLFCY